MIRAAALLLSLLLPVAAQAERLRVDVLVFLQAPFADERGTAPRHPDSERAIALDDVRGLAYAGISVLPESASTLGAEWARLSAQRGYQPLLRLSWLQLEPPAREGAALRVFVPSGDGIGGLDGWLRLNLGKQPLLVADLEYVQAGTAIGADGQKSALGWRLQEQRRLAPDTLHYFDSARLGLLARVTRLP